MTDLLYTLTNNASVMTENDNARAMEFCEGYKEFLDMGKTERAAVEYAVKKAEAAGFKPFEYGKKYNAGDKVYLNQKGKSAVFAVIGKKGSENGFRIIAAHVDNPRLDIKYCPVYEDGGVALFKTHYYGGIRKYQWLTVPLMLCGTVFKTDGTKADIRIGDKPEDPVFCITDLLPHLGADQNRKTLGEAYTGESMNVLAASLEDGEAEKDKIKTTVFKILNDIYGITEKDLLTAELSFVPAEKARDLGLDRSMILAFGHDDRVCSYPALEALFATDVPEHTAVAVITDKEEIGSMGITGLRSAYLYDFLAELANGEHRKAFALSKAISADVSALFDPNYAEVFDRKNNPVINHGVCINRFTGARGKSGASDATAEFTAEICALLEQNDIPYQLAEMGKVDIGGGGTVSQFLADRNIETLDVGVGVLSMHAPFEVASKSDIYMMYKLCVAFFK